MTTRKLRRMNVNMQMMVFSKKYAGWKCLHGAMMVCGLWCVVVVVLWVSE